MPDQDTFWNLKGASNIDSQDAFDLHLTRSDSLKNVLYTPDLLTGVNHPRYRITAKTFQKVSFSKTIIESVIFRNCTFEDCQFIGSVLKNCEFHECKFINTNMHKIQIQGTFLDPRSLRKSFDKRKHANIGVHVFQQLLKNSDDLDQPIFENDAKFYFFKWLKYQKFYEIIREKNSTGKYPKIKVISYIMDNAWEFIAGYGLRLRHIFASSFLAIILLSITNFFLKDIFGLTFDGGGTGFLDSIYFTTVSLTTLGYGDITPSTSVGRVFASAQSIFGFFMFATLASTLIGRISRK